MNVAEQLHILLTASGIPIDGVSVGTRDDSTTWEIQFAPEASLIQQQEGKVLIGSYTMEQLEQLAQQRELDRQVSTPIIKAIVATFAPLLGKTVEETEQILRTELLNSVQ